MKVIANDLRSGNVIEFQDSLWNVVKNPEHIKPGKGGAYVQIELRNLFDSRKINKRFSSHQNVNKAYLEEKKIEYLYDEGQNVIFMYSDSFEQVSITRTFLKDNTKFLLPGTIFIAKEFNAKIIEIQSPEQIVFTIKDTEIFMKSYRESPSYKSATTENDVRIMVPSYINIGDKVVVNTKDCKFIEKFN